MHDDTAIAAHREADLQVAMDAFSHAYSVLGITLNARKTKVQPSPDNTLERQQPQIIVGEQCLSSVDNFTHLDSCLSSKAADLDAEIQLRLNSASGAFGRLRTRVFDNKNIYTSNTKLNPANSAVWLRGLDLHLQSPPQKCWEVSLAMPPRRIQNIKWQDRQVLSPWSSRTNFVWRVLLSVCPRACVLAFPRRSCMLNWPPRKETRLTKERASRTTWSNVQSTTRSESN